MSMYEIFGTDQSLEKEGVWQEYHSSKDGKPVFRVKLARSSENNVALTSRLETLFKPYRRAADTGLLPMEKKKEITRQAFAETVIKGWQTFRGDAYVDGIEAKGGEDLLPVTPANIIETFKKLPDLFTDLQSHSFDMSTYMQVNREEDAKN